MNIAGLITELYRKIDDTLPRMLQHSRAILSLNELVTIGVLQAMMQVTPRAFYHQLRDYSGRLFPALPSRTRLNRRLRTQQDRTGYFLAQPTGFVWSNQRLQD